MDGDRYSDDAKSLRALLCLALALLPVALAAQDQTSQPRHARSATPPPAPTFATTVTVIEAAPLPGVDLPIEKSAGAGADRRRPARSSAAAHSTSRRSRPGFNAVFVNEMQNNPFQPDINYRGYTASPLLGTPQGCRSTWTASASISRSATS